MRDRRFSTHSAQVFGILIWTRRVVSCSASLRLVWNSSAVSCCILVLRIGEAGLRRVEVPGLLLSDIANSSKVGAGRAGGGGAGWPSPCFSKVDSAA